MVSKKELFTCSSCSSTFPKWTGKCVSCGAFGTIEEKLSVPNVQNLWKKYEGDDLLKKSTNADSGQHSEEQFTSGIEECDRVLGGGLTVGSCILFGGQPGIGKSTLSSQIFANILKEHKGRAFYFSGEEPYKRIAQRIHRTTSDVPDVLENAIFTTSTLEDIVTTITQHKPVFVVVDSLQMIRSHQASFGSMTQIRENVDILADVSRKFGVTMLLIGHITKNDDIAGPKILEHIVDTVLLLEGDSRNDIRILRSSKNRFGSSTEIGVFEMREDGLATLKNPSEYFLPSYDTPRFGSSVCAVREGGRCFLLEVQTLMVKTNFGNPRRTSHGVDISKFHLLLAIISKYTPFACDTFDSYVNVIGGLKIKDTTSDLAICASILSSRMEKEIPPQTVILGEVGLCGEIRENASLVSQLKEAKKLGFTRAIVPRSSKPRPRIPGLEYREISTIREFVKIIFS